MRIIQALGFRLFAFLLVLLAALPLGAQSAGTIRGSVLDPSGAAIKGATVQIQNPVSRYSQSTQTDGQGNFVFANIPYNPYHVSAVSPGFQNGEQDADVRSPVVVEVKITLNVGTTSESVTVTTAGDLVETDPSTHTDVDRELFDKLPLESNSSSLSSLVTLATPGVSADSNGLFHGLGDHASNSFSVDGQPITDQQSKVFSNQIPVNSVQSMEVIEGAPPAEFGGKTSLVIVATTRSGLGASPPHGDLTASYGTFGSSNGSFDLSYGGRKWGNFISLDGLNTGRFLDGPEYQVFPRSRKRAERVRTGRFQAVRQRHAQSQSRLQPVVVSDALNSYDAQNPERRGERLAIALGARGPTLALVGSAESRSWPLERAVSWIARGRCDRVAVVAFECPPATARARRAPQRLAARVCRGGRRRARAGCRRSRARGALARRAGRARARVATAVGARARGALARRCARRRRGCCRRIPGGAHARVRHATDVIPCRVPRTLRRR